MTEEPGPETVFPRRHSAGPYRIVFRETARDNIEKIVGDGGRARERIHDFIKFKLAADPKGYARSQLMLLPNGLEVYTSFHAGFLIGFTIEDRPERRITILTVMRRDPADR